MADVGARERARELVILASCSVWWNNHGARVGRPWFVKDLATGQTYEAREVRLESGSCCTVLDAAPKLGGSMRLDGRISIVLS